METELRGAEAEAEAEAYRAVLKCAPYRAHLAQAH
jgi:hypothetical protein